jgi:hypothetical protein
MIAARRPDVRHRAATRPAPQPERRKAGMESNVILIESGAVQGRGSDFTHSAIFRDISPISRVPSTGFVPEPALIAGTRMNRGPPFALSSTAATSIA